MFKVLSSVEVNDMSQVFEIGVNHAGFGQKVSCFLFLFNVSLLF